MATLPKWVVKMALCYPHNTFIRPPTLQSVKALPVIGREPQPTIQVVPHLLIRDLPRRVTKIGGVELTNHLVKIYG